MNAIAYVRNASSASGESIKSFNNQQENSIKNYCIDTHINLCEVFNDCGAGGVDFERQGWRQMEKYLDGMDGFIELLLVSDYDRISRDYLSLNIKIKYLKEKYGLTVIALSDNRFNENDEIRKMLIGDCG